MQKRYNVFVSDDLGKEIEKVTEDEGITMTSFFRQAVKLALIIRAVNKSKDSEILIKTGDKVERIIVVD